MAQRAPDWLLSMAAESDQLVEDSPRYRQDENRQLKQNLRQAGESALDAVQQQRAADLARRRAEARAMQDNGSPTPVETQTNTPRDMGPYEPPVDFGGAPHFEPANAAPPPPSPIGPPLSAPDITTPSILAAREMLPMPDDDPENDELAGDPEAEARLIAQLTGMPPKQVAAFALLGRQLKDMEDREDSMGLPVGRVSLGPSDSMAGGRPTPPPTGEMTPDPIPPPLAGPLEDPSAPITAPTLEDIPELAPPPEMTSSPMPPPLS